MRSALHSHRTTYLFALALLAGGAVAGSWPVFVVGAYVLVGQGFGLVLGLWAALLLVARSERLAQEAAMRNADFQQRVGALMNCAAILADPTGNGPLWWSFHLAGAVLWPMWLPPLAAHLSDVLERELEHSE